MVEAIESFLGEMEVLNFVTTAIRNHAVLLGAAALLDFITEEENLNKQ